MTLSGLSSPADVSSDDSVDDSRDVSLRTLPPQLLPAKLSLRERRGDGGGRLRVGGTVKSPDGTTKSRDAPARLALLLSRSNDCRGGMAELALLPLLRSMEERAPIGNWDMMFPKPVDSEPDADGLAEIGAMLPSSGAAVDSCPGPPMSSEPERGGFPKGLSLSPFETGPEVRRW